MKRFTVALTGGIAAGKSAVSDRFAALGIDIVDADIAARAVVAKGSTCLQQIVDEFGASMLLPDGTLDRRQLRERVFSNPGARDKLESITHPLIRDWMREQANKAESAYALLVIPLLASSPHYHWVDRVLLVTAPAELRIKRLMSRDGVSEAQALAALSAQATDAERLAIAHDVIDNGGDIGVLDQAVAALHQQYLNAVQA